MSAALSALGAYKVGTEVKGAYQVFRDKQKADAIQKAHLIGRGEQGIDGTAAKVGNYTFKQKYRKARILQKAGISKDERRRLFQNGVVGDSKEIDDLIEIEDQIADLEMNAWKFKDSQKEILDGLKALRADLDAALDSSPAEMAEKVRQLQEKMKKLTSANKSPLTVLPKLDDILENPGALRKAEVIELNQGGARNWKMKFENGSLDDLLNAEKPIVQKFVNSIRTGAASENIDATKIKIIQDAPVGEKGRLFEVRIIGSGHQRLVGCFENGVFSIMKYDSHAPEHGQTFMVRYRDLCR